MRPGTGESLHITWGESSGGSLRCSLLRPDHTVLATRDALCDGPVPSGLTLERLARVRAEHWAQSNHSGWRARARNNTALQESTSLRVGITENGSWVAVGRRRV